MNKKDAVFLGTIATWLLTHVIGFITLGSSYPGDAVNLFFMVALGIWTLSLYVIK